jgi:hypothetical protein
MRREADGEADGRRQHRRASLSPVYTRTRRHYDDPYRHNSDDATVFSPLGASRPRLTGDDVAAAAPPAAAADPGHISWAAADDRRRRRAAPSAGGGSRPDRGASSGVTRRVPSMTGVIAPGGLPHSSLREPSWTMERPGTFRRGTGADAAPETGRASRPDYRAGIGRHRWSDDGGRGTGSAVEARVSTIEHRLSRLGGERGSG